MMGNPYAKHSREFRTRNHTDHGRVFQHVNKVIHKRGNHQGDGLWQNDTEKILARCETKRKRSLGLPFIDREKASTKHLGFISSIVESERFCSPMLLPRAANNSVSMSCCERR